MDSTERLRILNRRFGPRVAAAILDIGQDTVAEFEADPLPVHGIERGARLVATAPSLDLLCDDNWAIPWSPDESGGYSGLDAPPWGVDLVADGDIYPGFHVPDGSYLYTLIVQISVAPTSGSVGVSLPNGFGRLVITADSAVGEAIYATGPSFAEYDNTQGALVEPSEAGAHDCVIHRASLLMWKLA